MKNLYIFLSLTLFLFLIHSLVNGQTIQPIERSVGKLHISIDPRMEILSIAQLLSNYPMINRTSPYSKDLMNHFKSYASHEAILMTDSLLRHGFTYDKPVAFMLYLSQPPELEQQIAFANYLMTESGGEDNLEKYRKSLQQFAKTSNFETFWNNKTPFYNQILDLSIADIAEKDLVKVLENYFNETKESYNIVILPSSIGGYATTITDVSGKEKRYACITTSNIKDNIPYLQGNSALHLVWHEFGHSFVNPATDKYSNKVESLNKLFEPIKEIMSNQAYGDWISCINEHVIRAIGVRLFELHLGSQESKILLRRELGQGFIYIEPLIEKLKEFEVQRDKNNVTFSEFLPELLDGLEDIPPDTFYSISSISWTFWVFGLLVICVPVFNIYVIIQIKRSDLKKKWLKYIAVIFLNVPAITYSTIYGLSSQIFHNQILLGAGFSYHGYIPISTLAFGLPLGGLYWFWKLKQKRTKV